MQHNSASYGTVIHSWAVAFRHSSLLQKAGQFAVCLSVSVLAGGILLRGLPVKWMVAFLGVLGIAVVMLISRQPRGVLLFVLTLTIPFYFVLKHISESHLSASQSVGVNVGLSDALVLLLLFLLLAEAARRPIRIYFFPVVSIPALLWLLLSSLSVLVSTDLQLALFQLCNMLKLLVLCWVVAISIRSETDLAFVITGMLLSLSFQAAVGIYQGITGMSVGLMVLGEESVVPQQDLGGIVVSRVQGTLLHPNSYAMYLTILTPLALALLFTKGRPFLRLLAGCGLCFGTWALIYSLSRSAWIGFLITGFAVLVLVVRRKRIRLPSAVLIAGVTCIVLLGVFVASADLILARLTTNDQGSALSRISLANTALAIFKDHPWLGVGLNNYTLVLPRYSALMFGNRPIVVHNAYLLVMTETGVVGLLGFLGVLVALLRQSWRIANQLRDDLSWAAGVGVFCGFLTIILHNMTDYALLGNILLTTQFWCLAGIASALGQRLSRPKSGTPLTSWDEASFERRNFSMPLGQGRAK